MQLTPAQASRQRQPLYTACKGILGSIYPYFVMGHTRSVMPDRLERFARQPSNACPLQRSRSTNSHTLLSSPRGPGARSNRAPAAWLLTGSWTRGQHAAHVGSAQSAEQSSVDETGSTDTWAKLARRSGLLVYAYANGPTLRVSGRSVRSYENASVQLVAPMARM